MEEIWKDVPNYEGLYQYSNMGRIKSLKRKWVTSDRIICAGNQPYPHFPACKDGVHQQFLVHILVATGFVPNPDNKPIVDHIDGNPSNNVWTNLRWTDHKGNSNNPISIKRMQEAMTGNNNGNKAVDMFDKDGNYIRTFESVKSAAEFVGLFDSHHITHCCRGRQPMCRGYVWKYKKDAV